MGYAEDMEKTRNDLAKIGPSAVEMLRKRMEAGGVSDQSVMAAQEILDRLGLRRTI